MNLVIPDASVILKWVLPDPEGETDLAAALQIRAASPSGKVSLKVPSLWVYEVGSTLARWFPSEAGEILDALLDFGPDEGDTTSRWVSTGMELVRRYDVAFDDASYHALALVEKGLFVSAAEKYVRKAARAGAVRLLPDWDEDR